MEQKKQIAVTAPGAYPDICQIEKNPAYLSLLMSDIAASAGEMTAVYQYLYQSWTLPNEQDELILLLRRIAQVEMHHLDLLGRTIVQLGGNPRCQAAPKRRSSMWRSGYVNYDQALQQFLLDNVKLEKHASTTYEAQANQVDSPQLSELLRRIAADEHLHMQLFEQCLSQIQ